MPIDDQLARSLIDDSFTGTYLWQEGRTLYANERCAQIFGATREEMTSLPFAAFVWPEDLPVLAAQQATRLAAPSGVQRYELRGRRRDGALVHIEVLSRGIEFEGRPAVAGVVLDVSERVRAEAARRAADLRFSALLENMQFLAVVQDRSGRVEFCNEALLRVTGLSREQVVGRDWFEVAVPAGEREQRRAEFVQGIAGGELKAHAEREIVAAGGELRVISWNIITLRGERGEVTGAAAIGHDLTESRRAAQKLLHDALHDSLTGLPNRALFMDRLAHRLALQKRRASSHFAVLFVDVDRFKVINDSLGHARGDELLVALARRLQRSLRPGDTVARLGGDEFTILIEDVNGQGDVQVVADRIQEELRAPFTLSGQEVFSGASIGIAHGNDGYARPEDLLRDADTALYRAKANGRGCWVEFDPSMHDRAMALLRLETDLRRAVERRELRLHYQPTVSLKTGEIVGAEALVRWAHPERGLVAPLEFIPLAEETGLIVPIGAWVLEEACRRMREWQLRLGLPHLQIGVNISSQQFLQAGFVAQVAGVLRETGLSPQRLRLEVTESILIERRPHVADAMTELRAMGVRIDLDDFGTGYSSLSYLHQLPIDTLKIDRSFVQRIGDDEEGLEIVQTILALARNLDMEVVAEGVENERQLELLRNSSCGYAQGYHLSRPVDSDRFEALLGGGVLPS